MILIKMDRLGIDPEKYKNLERFDGKFSYVLINPPNDFSLKTGDIVYLLKTGYKKTNSNNKTSETLNNLDADEESSLKANEQHSISEIKEKRRYKFKPRL